VLVEQVVQLASTAHDKHHVRNALLSLFADVDRASEELVRQMIQLATTAQDRRRVLEVLLRLVADRTDILNAKWLVECAIQAADTAEDQRRVLMVLVRQLADQTDTLQATWLVDQVVQLAPTIDDVMGWRGWRARELLNRELLAATRCNSELTDWLAALPALAPLSQAEFASTA
jgi:hypothetical protein